MAKSPFPDRPIRSVRIIPRFTQLDDGTWLGEYPDFDLTATGATQEDDKERLCATYFAMRDEPVVERKRAEFRESRPPGMVEWISFEDYDARWRYAAANDGYLPNSQAELDEFRANEESRSDDG